MPLLLLGNQQSKSWPVSIFTGGAGGQVQHFRAAAAPGSYGMAPPQVTSVLKRTTDSFGSYVGQGTIHAGALAQAGSGGANLVTNPTGTGQSGTANYTGWSVTNGATHSGSWSGDNYGGSRFLQTASFSLASLHYDGWEQPVSLFSNQIMSIQAILDWGGSTPPSGVGLYVDIVNAARTAVIAGSSISLTTAGIRVWEAGTFNTGANTSGFLRFYVYNTSGSTQTIPAFAITKIQLEYSQAPTIYVDHSATRVHNTLFDGSGNMQSSSNLKTNVPNSMAWTSNLTLQVSSSGTSPNITMTFWFDNGTSGTDATIWNPDGTTINAGHTTSTSGQVTLTSVTSGASIYLLMYYNKPSSSMVLQVSKTPFTNAQVNAAYADGGYTALSAATSASPTITGGFGGAVHSTGGSGSGRMFN